MEHILKLKVKRNEMIIKEMMMIFTPVTQYTERVGYISMRHISSTQFTHQMAPLLPSRLSEPLVIVIMKYYLIRKLGRVGLHTE